MPSLLAGNILPVCGKYPDGVSGTYEEHKMDILRKNRVKTRLFCPFWVGRERMSASFDPAGKEKPNHKQANEKFFRAKRRGG